MTNRMTGVSGLIDTESLVTATMKPYKLKVETQKQKLQTMQWQQEQYRTILKDSKGFFDKYLDSQGSNSLSLSSKYTGAKFTSDKESIATATTSSGAIADTYTVNITQLASKATDSLSTTGAQTITIGTGASASTIGFTADADGNKTVANYNKGVSDAKTNLNNLITAGTNVDANKAKLAELNANTITAKYSEFTKTVTFTADNMGKNGFKLSSNAQAATDKPLQGTITNSNNKIYDLTAENLSTNSKTIDGVTFNFSGTGTAVLTGKKDITDIKKNITSFVNDYNTLLTSINAKIYETRDKSYTPLTDEQRTAMSDTQIEKWEKKAQTGLLRKDDYLEELSRNMKDAMSTYMSSTGMSLEEIGIEPVKYEYTDKNGLLEIDDEKLTKALETNLDKVTDLFTKGDTENGGVITKLKDVINSGAILSTSDLVLKAGKDTGLSSLTNEMTKQLTDMKKKLKEMETGLTTREDGLYTKYASLESALSNMQAQQSSLSSYFGSN